MPEKCCDKCNHYDWYYDYCMLWKCEKDARSTCDYFNKDYEVESDDNA